jgi:hypothetical protein
MFFSRTSRSEISPAFRLKRTNMEAYKAWLIQQADFTSYSVEGILDLQKKTRPNIQRFLARLSSIKVRANMTVREVGDQLWGAGWEKLPKKWQPGYLIRKMYCYQVTREGLQLDRTLVDYDIENDYLLVTEEKEWEDPNGRILKSMRPTQHVSSFCDYVLSKTPMDDEFGLRYFNMYASYKSVMLYTEEDVGLATYVRTYFSHLHALTGSLLKIAFLEQPHRLKGVSALDYWKSKLSGSVFRVLNTFGYLKYKPFHPTDLYEVARTLSVEMRHLPCVIIYKDFEKQERIVIQITGDFVTFFRSLVTCLEQVHREIEAGKQWKKEQLKSQFKILKSPHPAFSDAWEADMAEQRAAGYWLESNADQRVQQLYKEGGPYPFETFTYFQEQFSGRWNDILAQYQAKSGPHYQFDFHGNTVFVNNPEGKVTFENFFNQNI